MKKILLFLTLLFTFTLNAQENDKTAGSLYLKAGACDNLSSVPLELYLTAPDTEITALELYITLPAGLETISEGTLNPVACSATHRITQGIVGQSLFVSIASIWLEAFTASDAPLCTWLCDLSSLADGEYTINVTGKFAVGVKDNEIQCYTSADQDETIVIKSTATGVEKVEIKNEKAEIYDLRGIRLSEPQRGAINIINGKKVKL